MSYLHTFIDSKPVGFATGKVIGVGRNYLQHINELNNAIPTVPLLFMKPATSLVSLSNGFSIPSDRGECQHEIELAVLIGQKLQYATENEIPSAIVAYALALDLTLRTLQQQLKEAGHPWEMAKAFDGACPISPFIPAEQINDPQQLDLTLTVNNALRQQGNTRQMLYPIKTLIAYISQYFTLLPGDIVLTGTPAGVGALQNGDELLLQVDSYTFTSRVI